MFKLNQEAKETKETKNIKKGRFWQFIADKRGVAGINVLLEIVVSVAIIAVLIGIVTAAIPGLWTTVMAKITDVLS